MRQFALILAVGCAIFFASSCATVISGRKQSVKVTSTPESADITLNGQLLGHTPSEVPVPRGETTVLVIKKEGYDDYTLSLTGTLSPTFWISNSLNCLLIGSGTFGTTTDMNNGSAYEYAKNEFHVELRPKTGFKETAQLADGAGVTKEAKVKRYVLSYYDILNAEITAGAGERLDALRELMGYGSKPLADFAKMIATDLKTAKDPNDFAERMSQLAK